MFKNIFLCLVSAFLLNACEKTTYLNGKVVNKVTGEPVDSASVFIQVLNSHATGQPEHSTVVKHVNNKGEFSFSDNRYFYIFDIRSKNYLYKDGGAPDMPALEEGTTNDLVINLVPLDGLLKLEIKNTSNITDTLFLAITSDIFNVEYHVSQGIIVIHTFEVNGQSTIVHYEPLPSNEKVKLYWGYVKAPLYTIHEVQLAPSKDSVYISRGDTVIYSIAF